MKITHADVLGFSNGGQTALDLALRHPDRVRRLVLVSMFYKRSGTDSTFWQGMAKAQFSDMPQLYKDVFLSIRHDSAALHTMFVRDSHRMQTFTGWTDDQVRSISAPALVVIGDRDVTRPEHAVEMFRTMPSARLAILPGVHGSFMGEQLTKVPGSRMPELFVAMVNEFLK